MPTAARLADELEAVGTVAVFEDPMLKSNLEWYRMLREKTHIPIALHLGAPTGVLAALKAECIDYVNLGGSAAQVRKAAALAEAADVPCWIQMGGLCTGILAAYSVHLQATLPNATLPCDELPFTREADVLAGGLDLSEGHFTVPTGPGLGIEVDMGVIERYRVCHSRLASKSAMAPTHCIAVSLLPLAGRPARPCPPCRDYSPMPALR